MRLPFYKAMLLIVILSMPASPPGPAAPANPVPTGDAKSGEFHLYLPAVRR